MISLGGRDRNPKMGRIGFEIRNVHLSDEDQLYSLAEHLNTVNLPHDRSAIREIIERSCQSFSGAIANPNNREYVFVLVDLDRQRLAGTSMIVAQLGRRDAPYIYFDVRDEEKYSQTLDRHFRHTVLRIGYSYDGPTEIGGLIVHPDYRSRVEKLGQAISFARFLFIAAHRHLFHDEILAELLPPLEPDGTSHLWEALGRHFTGLSYGAADILSKKNKEFIKSLFPDGDVYATLLPQPAQEVIGKVGAQTRGVERLLRRVGFRYAHRIDPFDGGPHFTALADEISLIRATRRVIVSGIEASVPTESIRSLCALDPSPPESFRCVLGYALPHAEEEIVMDAGTAEALGIGLGARVVVLGLG